VYHSGNLFAAGGNNFYFAGKQIQFDENIKSFAVTKQSSGELISLILTEQNLIYSYKADSDEQKLVFKGVSDIESFALADLKNDGNNYLVFNSANQIYALNLNGNFADNFPVSIKNDEKPAGMPLISDINNDKMADIISVSLKGNIFACLLYTSPSPRDRQKSRMPSSA
jgi:hypothetical protein